MRIDEINALSQVAFVDALGWVFEHSPWVAERAWERRPFESIEALHRTMVEEVERATPEEQMALLRAHPDLGARTKMSTASAGEQAAAGLDRKTPDGDLNKLNAEYRKKFGFPFLCAVKGYTLNDILLVLTIRLDNPQDEEFREALLEAYRIAWFRLEAVR